MEFHQAKRAQATLVLFRHPAPLEYGLVLTDEEQRVVRFVEKPSWGQVVTHLVNTGIYLLSPQVLEQIPPDRPWDFGKDVFPALLESGGGLYGVPGVRLLVRHGGLRGLSGLVRRTPSLGR